MNKLLSFTLALTMAAASAAKAADNSTMILYVFREDCYNKFIAYDFSDQECLKVTISKAIGLAIVVGSGILKLPQIIKILSSGSVEGIAAMSQYLETMIFMQTAGQAMKQNIPFSVYGESLIIMCQNFIIIALIWQFNKDIGIVEKFTAALFGLGYAYLLFLEPSMIPEDMWQLISSSNSILSKYIRM